MTLLISLQEEKNRPGGGGGGRRDDQYNDRYSQPQQAPYGQQGGGYNQQPQVQPMNRPMPQGGAENDPYAPYGGYQNYVALWYSAMAQQGQQPPGQGPPGQGQPPAA